MFFVGGVILIADRADQADKTDQIYKINPFYPLDPPNPRSKDSVKPLRLPFRLL